ALLECLAAVAGVGHVDAEHGQVLVVARVNADLAEIHRPGIDAVNAIPGLAAVGRLVDAAVLMAVWPLSVLDVCRLPPVVGAIGPCRGPAAGPPESASTSAAPTESPFAHRTFGVDQLDRLGLLAALEGNRDLVVRFGRGGDRQHLVVSLDRL